MNSGEFILNEKKPSFINRLSSLFVRFLKTRILTKKYMLFAFFTPILVMLLTFLFTGMIFGKTSFLALDMNAQYIYFFEQLRDALTGKESFFYTLERSLGGEFFGYYTYYLASPLSLIVVLFPDTMIVEAIGVMMVLKSALASLAFCIYLYNTRHVNSVGFGMFSVAYAFCAYATAYQTNIMWMDALIWLPLIALGIRALIREGKFKLFVLSLSLGIWSNYYIGYMLCIFAALYFVFFLASHSKAERNPNGVKLHILKSCLRFFLYTCLVLAITAGVLLCAIYSLSFGKSDGFDPSKLTFTVNIDFIDVIAKMFIGTFDTFRPEGKPHIYAGTLALLLLPLFFISKKIKLREKIGYSALVTFFIASFTISALNLFWHGFSEPVWLNYRYSFIFSFIILIMAYRAYEGINEVGFKYFAVASGALIFILFIAQKTADLTRYDGDTANRYNIWGAVWLTSIFLGLYLLLFYLLKREPKKLTSSATEAPYKKRVSKTRVISIILCALVCTEALVSACISWAGQFDDAGLSTKSSYDNFKRSQGVITEFLEKKEIDGFFRAERLFQRKSNDNLVLNINGVSEFTSTYNKGAKDFLKRLGYKTQDQSALYRFTDELADSLLGIKYVISDELINKKPEEIIKSDIYKEIAVLDGKYTVYENKHALPIMYAVNKDVLLADMSEEMSSSLFAIYIAELMTGVDLGYYMTEKKLDTVYNELMRGAIKDASVSDTEIRGTLTAKENQIVFTTLPYDRMWQVHVDGVRVEAYKCFDAMLAFDIEAGEHTIEMKYVPMQWYVGIAITGVGCFVFSLLVILEFVTKLRQKSKRKGENL